VCVFMCIESGSSFFSAFPLAFFFGSSQRFPSSFFVVDSGCVGVGVGVGVGVCGVCVCMCVCTSAGGAQGSRRQRRGGTEEHGKALKK
jgi:hypothetical protein